LEEIMTQPMSYSERALKLAEHLETTVAQRGPGRFNLLVFFLHENAPLESAEALNPNNHGLADDAIRHPIPLTSINFFDDHCGYAACAMGEACGIPEFQALGLSMTPTGHVEYRDPKKTMPVYDGSAIRDFFKISGAESHHLFFADEYERIDDPLLVAARLREFTHEKRSRGEWA
jgi:hypothetical protein